MMHSNGIKKVYRAVIKVWITPVTKKGTGERLKWYGHHETVFNVLLTRNVLKREDFC